MLKYLQTTTWLLYFRADMRQVLSATKVFYNKSMSVINKIHLFEFIYKNIFSIYGAQNVIDDAMIINEKADIFFAVKTLNLLKEYENNAQAISNLLIAIGLSKHPMAISILKEYTQSNNIEIKLAAYLGLYFIGSQEYEEIIREIIDAKMDKVCPWASSYLSTILFFDKSKEFCADMLIRITDPIKNKQYINSILYLEKTDHDRVVKALVSLFDSPRISVHRAAFKYLRLIKDCLTSDFIADKIYGKTWSPIIVEEIWPILNYAEDTNIYWTIKRLLNEKVLKKQDAKDALYTMGRIIYNSRLRSIINEGRYCRNTSVASLKNEEEIDKCSQDYFDYLSAIKSKDMLLYVLSGDQRAKHMFINYTEELFKRKREKIKISDAAVVFRKASYLLDSEVYKKIIDLANEFKINNNILLDVLYRMIYLESDKGKFPRYRIIPLLDDKTLVELLRYILKKEKEIPVYTFFEMLQYGKITPEEILNTAEECMKIEDLFANKRNEENLYKMFLFLALNNTGQLDSKIDEILKYSKNNGYEDFISKAITSLIIIGDVYALRTILRNIKIIYEYLNENHYFLLNFLDRNTLLSTIDEFKINVEIKAIMAKLDNFNINSVIEKAVNKARPVLIETGQFMQNTV